MIRNIIIIAGAIVAYIWMKRVKSGVPTGGVNQDPLVGIERVYVWLLSFASPLIAGAIFYYGWKKILPKKASSANGISWIAAFLIFAAYIGYVYFVR